MDCGYGCISKLPIMATIKILIHDVLLIELGGEGIHLAWSSVSLHGRKVAMINIL